MTFYFRRNETVRRGIRRIVIEQINKAILETGDESLSIHDAVHQVRKRCKMIRAVLRLVRAQFELTYRFENAWFRDSARQLSSLRDAQSILESFERLRDHFADESRDDETLDLHRRLCDRRDRLAQVQQDGRERLSEFAERMQVARARVRDWPLKSGGFRRLSSGLKKVYKQNRRAFLTAYKSNTNEAFHDWRKRVKYHWNHMRLLRPISKRAVGRRIDELDHLADLLGEEHDLAVLEGVLQSEFPETLDESAGQIVQHWICHRREQLRQEAQPLGKQLFSRSPKSFVRRMKRYWKDWRD